MLFEPMSSESKGLCSGQDAFEVRRKINVLVNRPRDSDKNARQSYHGVKNITTSLIHKLPVSVKYQKTCKLSPACGF